MNAAQAPRRVAVIGGGIAGLASAYFLLKQGLRPVIFEAADRLGGLGAHFEHDGLTLDRFYHVILDSDSDLCALIAELGLAGDLVWRETGMGFHIGDNLYGFNGPIDVLRFRALPFVDRLRTGLGALYVTQIKRNGLDLDQVYARDWLLRVFGPRIFSRIWEPLLRAKFGDRFASVPAYWVWNTLTREKNGKQEIKGYLRGTYRALTDALYSAISTAGGEVRLNSPVDGIDAGADSATIESRGRGEHFAAAISTLPLPLLKRTARGRLAECVPHSDLEYQGVVNAIVVSRRQLERYYWTIVVDPRFAFQGVVETTHVLPPEWIGDRHLIYVMNYCDADSEIYARSDDLVRRQAVDGLSQLYPHFRAADVEAVYVFRAPHVEPVWKVGYLKSRPPARLADTRAYISTTAQAYPRVTAWNTSVALARETVTAVVTDLCGQTNQTLERAAAA
ncbi:MAG: NAD(P)/FAD-dependent oxidoreductase [Deltaproteobacteria bacterium]|nr:NAD(P)/FAD-dependent oxidoreductase [Deltaproteobacteria bacterium]